MLVTQISNKKMETRSFIEKVKKYHEIFDTTHAGFKQQDDKNGAWEKIAQEFHTDANVCKKKFRTLRERYTRELRRSYLEPNTPIKFEFFKELSFLNPYIKFRSIMFETADGKTVVTKREELSMDKSDVTNDMKIIESDSYYDEEPDQQTTYVHTQDNTGTSNIIYEAAAGTVPLPEFSGNILSVQPNERQSQSEDEVIISLQQKSKDNKRKHDSWDDVDDNESGDKYFAMSVSCSLKRLSTINNLKAKVEIYQILEKYASKENH